MSKNKASPLATAFMWAMTMAAGFAALDEIAHVKPVQIPNDAAIAAVAAGVAAYVKQKGALAPR